MYFKASFRQNPQTGELSAYYRLVESYRNADNRVCHRTMLNVGFLDLKGEQLNVIQKILTEKIKNPDQPLFDFTVEIERTVKQYVEMFYTQMIEQKKVDIHKTAKKNKKDLQLVDLNSIRHKDVREIGGEWLAQQALEQLQLADFLKLRGWNQSDIQLAHTHIIARAVHPASEFATARWIKENSAVCEITGFDVRKITKDKLYYIARKLFEEQQLLEQHLSTRTNELFDIQDKIVLYDLTNTYFEGRKQSSQLAKFGRSKEKRTDAKLVVLALVINPEGFIKYSSVLEGNMADSKTLPEMIEKLRINTSQLTKKALVVMDAGIVTEENLKLIAEKGYDYLCVSRTKLKEYTVAPEQKTVTVRDNKKQTIELTKVNTDKNTDYYLKVHSSSKQKKEQSMNQQFRERFEQGMEKIAKSLTLKGGIKQEDKVYERIGKLKQKYPSIQRYFDIELTVEEVQASTKKATTAAPKRIVTDIKWTAKENVEINKGSGIYFLRTSLHDQMEDFLWKSYNIIREIEATFRVLKTDLDLRPIYHKTDANTMAHLHLGLLAYWVVNTVRYQLKSKDIKHDWTEILRIMNTQKVVTTLAQNDQENLIVIRKSSEPNKNVKQIYDALHYKYVPFVRKKFVVHKTEIKKNQTANGSFIKKCWYL